MAITHVVEKNGVVYVYKPNGSMGPQISVSKLPGSGLTGYTSESFSIQQGSSIYTYNEKGQVIDSLYTGTSVDSFKNHDSPPSLIEGIIFVLILLAIYWFFIH